MRKRRYVPDSDENHDRWLISYADLVTLLFAFFVVMYAISQVNEGKYRVLSQSLNSAFAAREGVRLIELPATDQSDAMQIQLDQLRAARSAQKEQERKERS
jgi:chemotaxis protein MotB